MTFEQDKDETPVLFRASRAKGAEITAVFPTIAANAHGDDMTCYAHIGQHSACSFGWFRQTRAAKPEEYASLKRELEGAPYGYRLRTYSRITRAMHAARRKEARS